MTAPRSAPIVSSILIPLPGARCLDRLAFRFRNRHFLQWLGRRHAERSGGLGSHGPYINPWRRAEKKSSKHFGVNPVKLQVLSVGDFVVFFAVCLSVVGDFFELLGGEFAVWDFYS